MEACAEACVSSVALTGFFVFPISFTSLFGILLFFAIPRINTNEIAHRLIERFGTLDGVFDADIKELTTVDGVGENSAALIKLVDSIRKRLAKKDTRKRARMNRRTVTTEYIIELFRGEKDEKLYLIALDNASNIICASCIASGEASYTDTTVSKILRASVHLNASSVILAHNHPSGIAVPSTRDIEMNQKIYMGLRALEVGFIDHFIVSGERCNPMMH
jgi:DNA repair protein RadC